MPTTAPRECDRCRSPIEKGDLRCAICGVVVVEVVRADVERVSLQVLRCRGCGAAVSYNASIQAPQCSFCSSVMEVEVIEDPVEQTEAYLPFAVSGEEARRVLRRWLGEQGFFAPSDLAKQARLESLKPLWWTGWAFDARARVSWAADSNAGAGRSAWAPHSGQAHLVFDDVVVSASRGLREKETDLLATSYDLQSAVAGEQPTGLWAEDAHRGEVVVERFDVQRSLARRHIMQSIDRFAAAHVQRSQIPGTRYRKVHVACMLEELTTRRFGFPAYVLAYRYQEQLYRVVISGQDAEVVCGKSPFSMAKLLVVVGLALGGAVILALILGAVL